MTGTSGNFNQGDDKGIYLLNLRNNEIKIQLSIRRKKSKKEIDFLIKQMQRHNQHT